MTEEETMQNVVIRGKKSNGKEQPVLVDSDGKIETTATITGDITIGEVEVSNFPATQPISGEVTVHDIEGGVVDTVTKVNAVDSITSKINIDTIDHLTSITNPVDFRYTDEYGWSTENTPQGESRSVTPFRIVGGDFSGDTVDSNFWTAATGTGGSITQASGLLTLATGATDGNDVSITSVRKGRFVGGTVNRYRAQVILGDTGTSNNIRRWGAYDANNGVFFELNGTTLNVVIRKAAGDTTVAQAAWSEDTTFTIDTNMHTYEIYWTSKNIYFGIDGDLKHIQTATTSKLIGSSHLYAKTENNNGTGLAANKTIALASQMIHRLGHDRTEATSKYIAGVSAGTVCKYGPGKIQKILWSAGATGNGVTIYDATSVTGTPIIQFTGTKDNATSLDIGVPFFTGLTVVTTGTSSYCTVVYE